MNRGKTGSPSSSDRLYNYMESQRDIGVANKEQYRNQYFEQNSIRYEMNIPQNSE